MCDHSDYSSCALNFGARCSQSMSAHADRAVEKIIFLLLLYTSATSDKERIPPEFGVRDDLFVLHHLDLARALHITRRCGL